MIEIEHGICYQCNHLDILVSNQLGSKCHCKLTDVNTMVVLLPIETHVHDHRCMVVDMVKREEGHIRVISAD